MSIRARLSIFACSALLALPCLSGGADPHLLLISVLQTDNAELARELLANKSGTGINVREGTVATRTYGTDSARAPRDFQQIQVVEGQRAYYSLVYRSPQARFLWAEGTGRRVKPNTTLVTTESGSGFSVQAELDDEEIRLQLDYYSGQSQNGNNGQGVRQATGTILRGHLGDWLDAGGSLLLDDGEAAGNTYSVRHDTREQSRLLIKVELVSG